MFRHGTIIRTGVTYKKITCYMRDSAYRCFIVEKAKIFWSYVFKVFEVSRVWENVESWLVYANKFFWISQPYFSTDIIKGVSNSFSFLLLRLLLKRKFLIKFYCFNRYKSLYTSMKLKKINCFIYIALAKYCWVINLGEIKSDQK